MNFKDKVCVVTGGANGIGLAVVNEFASCGAKVAFIDKDKAAGERALASLLLNGAQVMFYCDDISEKEALESFANQVIDTYGKIDYLINNACLSRKGILSDCDFEDFNYVLKVGVTAPYMLSKLFLNNFSEGGSIVNISSTRSVMSQPDTESYSAAKGGISALTHSLAVSLAGRVRVNSVSPGWIDTNLQSIQSKQDKMQHLSYRIGRPSDIVRTVMFLCDEENSFITGENITVDGGMTKQMIYNDDYGWSYSAEE